MKFAVIVFPGSNCDLDMYAAIKDILGEDAEYVQHYETSLEVLRQISESGTVAKSGIMVGLGETPDEVAALMDDLRDAGCRILTIGQYLQPTHKHYPVAEYVTPAQFTAYKELGLKKGFTQVESAPLVRSSYHAEKSTQYLQKR